MQCLRGSKGINVTVELVPPKNLHPLLTIFLNETTASLSPVCVILHGYFVKYSAEEPRPPLIFVLSEQLVKVVLFPFVNKSDEPLVERGLAYKMAVVVVWMS